MRIEQYFIDIRCIANVVVSKTMSVEFSVAAARTLGNDFPPMHPNRFEGMTKRIAVGST